MIKTLKRRIFEELELNLVSFFEDLHTKRELVTGVHGCARKNRPGQKRLN